MQIQENISLKPFNTFGIDVKARYLAVVRSVSDLQTVPDLKSKPSQPQLVLGGGSNILFTRDYGGLIIKNEIGGVEKISEDETSVYIKAGAGENWHKFVLFCIENNYAGIENLSLIPGCVGASPMQNIGAYGVEIKDVFHELTAFHLNGIRYDPAGTGKNGSKGVEHPGYIGCGDQYPFVPATGPSCSGKRRKLFQKPFCGCGKIRAITISFPGYHRL
jgi:UDP-N-acetylenolpyruvoylglucosamine reductase